MKRRLLLLLLPLIAAGCTRPRSHSAVREAAEGYYTMLIEGRYDDFVGGFASADSLPADYRAQLVDAVAQTMSDAPMNGLCRVTATQDEYNDSTATVVLQLQFADSTTEQIQLPLVLGRHGWRMQ